MNQIWNYLKSKGLSSYAIAGIMGNMYYESRLQSNNLQDSYNRSLNMTDAQYTSAVDNNTYKNFIDDRAGYGLVQWTHPDLKKGLYNLCKSRKKSISDRVCQLDCLIQQLTDMKILDKLNEAASPKDASMIFLTQFEHPKNQSDDVKKVRAEKAQDYYDSLGGGKKTMKYTSSNKPLVCMQTNSTCYKGTSKMTVKGVLWHSTGANNTTIKRYVQPSDNDPNKQLLLTKIGTNTNRNDWNHVATQAGLNAWIGTLTDGSVAAVQTMPWDYKPWGCGSGSKGSCNNGWVQFEICEDNLANASYFNQVYKEACELTAYLCKLYNLNPTGTVNFNGVSVPVILCHQDSYKLGLGSNHSDIYHWFNRYGKTMDDVRKDVATLMGSSTSTSQQITTSQSSKRELGLGDSGEDVKQLQSDLISLGYSCGALGADSDFGSDTLKAVKKFQQEHNLVIDGIVGNNTYTAIENALKNKKESTKSTTTTIVNEIYRIRKSWADAKSQVGAYKVLNNAIKACKNFGVEYKVYNSKGEQIYPETNSKVAVIEEPIKTPEPVAVETPKPAKTYNNVMLGSSSKDERGQYRGGQAGDQTGKEVYILNWYDGGWTSVIRPNSTVLAEKIAAACENACDNDNIGYNQYNRNSIYTEAKKVGLNLSKIVTPCDCDCSSLVSTCCICAGLSADIFYAGNNMRTTGNLISACEKTGQFTVLTSTNYTKNKDYLKRGDILLSNGHTVIVLANGAKAGEIAPVVVVNSSHLVKITANKLNVRSGPSTNYAVVTQVSKGGVFTIIEEKEGWGKLKSGAGWIELSYTEKV